MAFGVQIFRQKTQSRNAIIALTILSKTLSLVTSNIHASRRRCLIDCVSSMLDEAPASDGVSTLTPLKSTTSSEPTGCCRIAT